MIDCVTEQFGISCRQEAGQRPDDGGGDDSSKISYLISLPYATASM